VFGDDNSNRKVIDSENEGTPPKGPLAGIGKTLADKGIRFRSLLTNEIAGNVRGGATQGHSDVGQYYLGTDLDLDRIVGWSGAQFHFTLYHDFGTGLNKHVTGTFFKQQDIYKNEYPQWHFGLFALEQRLFGNRLDIIVGRLGTTAYYGHLTSNCFFQAGVTCGVPVVLNSEAGFGLLPSATWGGNVKWSFSRKLYAEAGAFEVNPTIAPTNGLHWSTKGATGFTVPFEVGYQDADFRKVRFPTTVKGGFYASTGERTDPFFNARDQSAALTGTKLRDASTLRSGLYLMGERAIWRPDPATNRSLTLFGGIIQPLEHEEVVDRQIYGGLLLRRPFDARPRDTIGLSVAWLHLSDRELAYLRDARVRAHGPLADENPNEVNFELNYGIGIGRAIRLTPNVQYTLHPDSSNLPTIAFVPKNMVTFGLKLTIDVATLVGLPSQPTSD